MLWGESLRFEKIEAFSSSHGSCENGLVVVEAVVAYSTEISICDMLRVVELVGNDLGMFAASGGAEAGLAWFLLFGEEPASFWARSNVVHDVGMC